MKTFLFFVSSLISEIGYYQDRLWDGSEVIKRIDDNIEKYQITVITVPGIGENGSDIQARIVKNLYRLWFSIPNMAGITWWNLGDGTAHGRENNSQAGLLDEDMNPKPAYQVLDELINHECKTNEISQTDNNGKVQFRGFYGKYKIEVIYQGKTFEREVILNKSGDNHFTIQL